MNPFLRALSVLVVLLGLTMGGCSDEPNPPLTDTTDTVETSDTSETTDTTELSDTTEVTDTVDTIDTVDTVDTIDTVDTTDTVNLTCTLNGYQADDEYSFADPEYDYYVYYGDKANGDYMTIEFVDAAITGPGTITLGGSDAEKSYKTCTKCMLVSIDCDAEGICGRDFFAMSGSIVATDFFTTGFVATLNNVELVEVVIDWESLDTSIKPGGEKWCVTGLSVNGPVETL